jgi:hypothetical protein
MYLNDNCSGKEMLIPLALFIHLSNKIEKISVILNLVLMKNTIQYMQRHFPIMKYTTVVSIIRSFILGFHSSKNSECGHC